MFHDIFRLDSTRSRHLNAPMLQERLEYLQHWQQGGADPRTLRGIAHLLLGIINYLDLTNKSLVSMEDIRNAAEEWSLRKRTRRIPNPNHNKKRAKKNNITLFVWHATCWLKNMGNLQNCDNVSSMPFVKEIRQYVNYMRHERGFSENTIKKRQFCLKRFFQIFADLGYTSLEKINVIDIDKLLSAILEKSNYARCTIEGYVCQIRSFITFAEQSGWCKKGMAKAIRVPRRYKEETLPYAATWDEVKKLLATTEGDHPTDIRDKPIIMLLAIYGLRCSEVTSLKLEDIDWINEIIYIKRAKNFKSQQFPLTQALGQAILRYLKIVRPNNCSLRQVFICRNAPYRPLGRTGLSTVVRYRWEKLGVKLKHYGAHSLRHSCASHLINTGVSLKEISDLLGHQDMESTRTYTRIDFTNLRKVADFNIGDLL